jgi:hypothetical protein
VRDARPCLRTLIEDGPGQDPVGMQVSGAAHALPAPVHTVFSLFSSTNSVSCIPPFTVSSSHYALQQMPTLLHTPISLQPYDFIIPVMRGVGSRMDSDRESLVPHSTTVACPTFGGRGLFNINNLVDCIAEAGNLFGQWTSGISTRGYANDILKIILAHEAQSNYIGVPKRMVYGRGYGGQVVNDLQHIVNCNYLAVPDRQRRQLRCPYANSNQFGGGLPSYCSSPSTVNTFRRLPASFSFTSYIIDGTRDLDKSDSSMWIQATNLVAHSALQSCPSSKCRQLYNNDPYLAARDALALLKDGWCAAAIDAGFSRDVLIQAASAFSYIGSTPAYSSMASATLPFLNAIIFRYVRCNAEDIAFLAAAANSPPWPTEFSNRYARAFFVQCIFVVTLEQVPLAQPARSVQRHCQ